VNTRHQNPQEAASQDRDSIAASPAGVEQEPGVLFDQPAVGKHLDETLPRPLLSAVVDSAPLALILVDANGCIRFCNRGAELLFGYTRRELLNLSVELLVPGPVRTAHRQLRESFQPVHGARPMGTGRELNGLRKDGTLVPVEVALEPLSTANEVFIVAAIVDVSERRRLARRFELLVDEAPIAIIQCDAGGSIELMNREAEQIFGCQRRELLGASIDLLLPEKFRRRYRALLRRFLARPMARRFGAKGRVFHGLRRDGTEFPVEIGMSPTQGDRSTSLLITIADISERRRLQTQLQDAYDELERRVQERTVELANANRQKELLLHDLAIKWGELEQLSREDPLTGLANRRDFDRRLADAIAQGRRLGTPIAVAMFDLDEFKRFNDLYGHALGDAVLKETANLMRRECRVIDVIARYGGDEFVLAFPHTGANGASLVCERIRRSFEAFDWTRLASGLAPTISAGVFGAGPDASAAELLAGADANLYEAKRRGHNRVV
jgi:diguanylate cyclase (GGDEF)-like protein/PAS domain S-box-containing protein